MRFRPRHYVLIAIILALGVWNFVRSHRPRPARVETMNMVPAGPIPQSAAWQAFDKVASLRDSGDDQFQTALSALTQQIDTASADQKADLHGCHTWLLFYRHNIHAAANDAWRQRSLQHLDNCTRFHRDISN